ATTSHQSTAWGSTARRGSATPTPGRPGTGSRRSRRATTGRTCSGATRTSRPPRRTPREHGDLEGRDDDRVRDDGGGPGARDRGGRAERSPRRRGAGAASGDRPPYAVEREIEDLRALVEEASGTAYAFGHSSGAVLALEAAPATPGITKLVSSET